MSEKVDVLAVLGAAVKRVHGEWFSAHDKYFGRVPGIEKELDKLKAAANEADEALAAVAELVEADRAYDEASREFEEARYASPAPDAALIVEKFHLKAAASRRRAAALARFGGES